MKVLFNNILCSWHLIALSVVLSLSAFGAGIPIRTKISFTTSQPNAIISVTLFELGDVLARRREHVLRDISGIYELDITVEKALILNLAINGENVLGYDSVGSTGKFLFIEPGDSLRFNIPGEQSRLYQDILITGRGSSKFDLLQRINARIKNELRRCANGCTSIESSIRLKSALNEVMNMYSRTVKKDEAQIINSEVLGILNLSCLTAIRFAYRTNDAVIAAYNEYAVRFSMDELKMPGDSIVSKPTAFIERARIEQGIAEKRAGNPIKMNILEITQLLAKVYAGEPYLSHVVALFLVEKARMRGWTSDVENAFRFYQSIIPSDDFQCQVNLLKQQLIGIGSEVLALNKYNLVDSTGRTVLLAEFKGKVILIDFMFFGCGGCYYMAPKLEQLQSKFRGSQDVVFLSVSIDRTMERFIKSIGKYSSMSSYHLFTGGIGDDHRIISDFEIAAYPSLVLIGRDGKLISARAPDPRTPAGFIELLNLINDGI